MVNGRSAGSIEDGYGFARAHLDHQLQSSSTGKLMAMVNSVVIEFIVKGSMPGKRANVDSNLGIEKCLALLLYLRLYSFPAPAHLSCQRMDTWNA